MVRRNEFIGNRLLLMGSKTYKGKILPGEVKGHIEEAIARKMTIIVGEAPGACRLYQDFLKMKTYKKVVVGHARSMRYNAGNWKTVKYGDDVHEREAKMIGECDSAIAIWADNSGVIAENLEVLKNRGKPTFVYEYSSKTNSAESSWVDLKRIYDPYFYMKEYWRKKKESKKRHLSSKM
jgi:hypothetical protein